jgi:hypothetical protein
MRETTVSGHDFSRAVRTTKDLGFSPCGFGAAETGLRGHEENSFMWTIRQEQTEAFRQHHLQKFEDEMVEHSKNFAPPICKVIGDEQVRVAIRSAMLRANGYGFTNRGPLRLFIEMMFLCGSSFDTDPQYAVVGRVLRSPADQMDRAEQIHLGYLEYLVKVSGPDAVNVRSALSELPALARTPLPFSSDDFVAGLLREMARLFPQKVAYVGEANLRTLIHEATAESQRYHFSTMRQAALLVVLMFAFGHGCTNDPLYPWISRTLRDEKIVSPVARAERLEKKALTWLEHVLARNRGREAQT